MIGSFLTRTLALLFGYIYPAYECFKTVEMNKPDIEQLRFWCQYWILVAGLTVCERIGDTFIGWVPMYGEAKLAFFIYLWFPKTKGTTYVYDSFFRPYVAKHETEIDRNLLELRLRAGDMAIIYWQKVASYCQTRIFDILQYVASQSNPPPVQRVPSTRRPTVTAQQQDGQPSSPASSEPHEDSTNEAGPSNDSKAKAAPATLSEQKTTPTPPLLETARSSTSTQVQVMQVDPAPPPPEPKEIAQPAPPPKEIMMEDAVRVTRARSRSSRITRPPSLDR